MKNQEVSINNEQLCLATIYAASGMEPLWVNHDGPNAKAEIILKFLETARAEGLHPHDYQVDAIKENWQSSDPDQLAQLETNITLGLLKYIHDITHGRIAPYRTDPYLFAEAGDKHFKPADVIAQATSSQDLAAYLAGLPPSHIHYRRLKQALRYFREIEKAGDKEPIAQGKAIFPGDHDGRLADIRQKLAMEHMLDLPVDESPVYDTSTLEAVRKFQKKYGLKQDGIIGRQTLAALNMTIREKINKILINLARWRWQEHDFGDRYIIVNIANFDLKLFDNGRNEVNMEVIVGKRQHQTPVFSDRIRYLDFNPFWNIPPSIARNEELKQLKQDPYYLVNRNVRLFSGWGEDAVELDSTVVDWQSVTPQEMNRYKLRQDPGPWNALGPVKFVFPNKYDVYIHGTPVQDLFDAWTRDFSHGCIRVRQPLLLAELILEPEEENWPIERILEIVAKGERKVVKLRNPLPVHITYQTVWVDNDGEIYFNNDNYERDKKLYEVFLPVQQ